VIFRKNKIFIYFIMYHEVSIESLSPAQHSRLRNGHGVRVKLGHGHKLHVSIDQHKKLHHHRKVHQRNVQ